MTAIAAKSLQAAREIATVRAIRKKVQQTIFRIRKDLYLVQPMNAPRPDDVHAIRCSVYGGDKPKQRTVVEPKNFGIL